MLPTVAPISPTGGLFSLSGTGKMASKTPSEEQHTDLWGQYSLKLLPSSLFFSGSFPLLSIHCYLYLCLSVSLLPSFLPNFAPPHPYQPLIASILCTYHRASVPSTALIWLSLPYFSSNPLLSSICFHELIHDCSHREAPTVPTLTPRCTFSTLGGPEQSCYFMLI